jgi:hypothetical protein
VVFYNIFFVGRYINCRFFVLFGDPTCSTWQNRSPLTSRLLFSFFFIQITLFCMYFLIIIVVCSSSSFFRLILKNGGMYVCGSGFEIKNDSSKCKMILSTINPGSGGA